jgi:hypothetical protein
MSVQAKINNDGIVIAVTETKEYISDPNYIPISEYQLDLIGQRWTGQEFVPIPAKEERSATELFVKQLFTVDERLAIRQRAKTDPIIEDFLDILASAGRANDQIDSTNVTLRNGLSYLQSINILSSERYDAIITALK